MKIKRLNLEEWQKAVFDPKEGEEWEREGMIDRFYSVPPHPSMTNQDILPNGQYLCGLSYTIICNGIEYHYKSGKDQTAAIEMFNYQLSLLNHRPLRPVVKRSIKTLIQEGVADRKMRDLYELDEQWHDLRDLRRDTMKFMFIHNEPKRSRR